MIFITAWFLVRGEKTTQWVVYSNSFVRNKLNRQKNTHLMSFKTVFPAILERFFQLLTHWKLVGKNKCVYYFCHTIWIIWASEWTFGRLNFSSFTFSVINPFMFSAGRRNLSSSPKVLVHRLEEELVVWLVQHLFKIQQSDVFGSYRYLHQVRRLLLVDVINYLGFRHLCGFLLIFFPSPQTR